MKSFALAALLAAAPVAGLADSLTLSVPLLGATLQAEQVDISLHYAKSGAAIEVVAFYVAHDAWEAPQVLRLRLENGEAVTFGLPGHHAETFRFAMENDALRLTPARVGRAQASY